MTLDHLRFGAYGLGIGLLMAVAAVVVGWWRRRELRFEVLRLREHLHTHMEISHEGNSERRRQLEQLRLENENLRVTIKAWQQKPGRHELRALQVYDTAIHRLLETTPGFSLAWEAALKEAEAKMQQSERGIFAFTRRFILTRSERQLSEAESKQASESEK